MDYQALANQLIEALKNSTTAGLDQLRMSRRNTFEDLNNRAAKRGTLYSTGGAAQQSRFDATKYLPGQAQLLGTQQQNEIKIKSDLLDTQRKIEAMNKAASELNKQDDAFFQSLLV